MQLKGINNAQAQTLSEHFKADHPIRPHTVILLQRLAVLQVYQITALCFRQNFDAMNTKCDSLSDPVLTKYHKVLRDDFFAFMFDPTICCDSDSTFRAWFQQRIGYLVHCKLFLYTFDTNFEEDQGEQSVVGKADEGSPVSHILESPDTFAEIVGIPFSKSGMLSEVVSQLIGIIDEMHQHASSLQGLVDTLTAVSKQ